MTHLATECRQDHRAIVDDLCDEPTKMLTALSESSAIGFAVIDTDLRFVHINPSLARSHGMPVADHIGMPCRDVFGDAITRIKADIAQLLASRERSLQREMSLHLPMRTEPGQWIATYFKIRGSGPPVTQVGVVVVETTALRDALRVLNTAAFGTGRSQACAIQDLRTELSRSATQYIGALQVNINRLIDLQDRSAESLGELAQHLDQRLITMQRLVLAIAKRVRARELSLQ